MNLYDHIDPTEPAELMGMAYWLKTYRANPDAPVPHPAHLQVHITAADLRAAGDEFQDWFAVAPDHADNLLCRYIQWRESAPQGALQAGGGAL